MDGYTYLIKVDTNGNAVLPSLSRNAKKADKSLGRINSTSKRSFGTLHRSASRGNSILSKTKSLLVGIGLTMSTGALAAGIYNVGANFEQTMSSVQAKMNATKTEMASLEDQAREMGASTKFTANQSGEALDFMAMAGYNVDEAISALPGTLNLAAASGLDLGRSADIATNILSQFRMKANDTDQVVDKLALGVTTFNTNMEEMSNAMNYWGPNAASLNITLSESVSTIGLLANNGLKGSLATRALGSSMTRLSKPTSQMQSVMSSLNLDFYDAQGNFIGMANMVDMLNDRLEGLNMKQRQAALSTVFGAEAIQEINILLAEGGDRLRKFTGQMDEADGAAKRMADTKMDNLAGDVTKLKSASQELGISLFEEVGPTLRAMAQEATLFVRSLDTKEVGLYLQNTVLTLRRGMQWFIRNREVIWGIAKGYASLRIGIIGYNVAIRSASLYTRAATTAKWAHVAATRGAAVATRALNTSISASPLGMIVGVISAAASAMALFASNTRDAKDAKQELNEMEERNRQREVEDLNKNTSLGFRKLEMAKEGELEDRQLLTLRRNAQARIESAQDEMVNYKAEIKDTPGYDRYLTLQKKLSNLKMGQSLTSQEYEELDSLKRSFDESGIISNLQDRELSKYQDIIKKNKRILEKTKGLIPEDKRREGGGLGEGLNDDFEGEKSGSSDISRRVSEGGSQQRVVNVRLGKFMEDINFNDIKNMDDIREYADEIRALFTEQFLRVLNSANQTSNG